MASLRHVLLLSPPYAVLTYAVPEWMPEPWPGQRVLVPLGRGFRVGIAAGPAESLPSGVEAKDILWPLDREVMLDQDYMDMARELSIRHITPLGRILETLLPRGLRSAVLSFSLAARGKGGFPARISPKVLAAMPWEAKSRLMDVWRSGGMRVLHGPSRETGDRVVRLLVDPPWPVRPNAKRRIELLEALYEKGPQSLASLARRLGPWVQTTAPALAAAGAVDISYGGPEDPVFPAQDCGCADGAAPLVSTPEQLDALEKLKTLLGGGGASLVHGVTGSGKTHVYLELADRCLRMGRSVVLLAPEVALACSLYRAVLSRFGQGPLLYHGYQSPARREETFLKVAAASGPVVVVGTRSALFLPVRRPGLIVLDEEHDESFKQEERLAYQAKEVAFFRAAKAAGLLVLGSATPDLKTYHAFRSGRIPGAFLHSRVGESRLPAVRLVDGRGERGQDAPLLAETSERLGRVVAEGGQAIVMLNRRGYAPLMYCLDCGQAVRCPDCHVGMTFHKGRERLVCHYCGLSYAYPMPCPSCGSPNFLPMGEGTERVEEGLRKLLPDIGILRMDRDVARRQERLEDILARFSRGEAQVLVGTQMLSKGHHFPNVTLVVAADADLGLNLPDYRAAERTFQLLVQVSGRAGRGVRPGEVVIQTRNPDLPFWNFVQRGDYEGFYEREIALREKYRYPPFVKLALLRLSFDAQWEEGTEVLACFGRSLRKEAAALKVTALGPAPAPLSRLRGRRRFHCLLKAADWPALRTLFHRMTAAAAAQPKLQLALDLDPVNML